MSEAEQAGSGETGSDNAARGGPIADAAARIIDEGSDVRERIRNLVLDESKGDGFGLASLRRTVSEIVDGVTRSAKATASGGDRELLGEAVSGISDGLGSAANATKLAIEEAEARGAAFAKDDLKKAAADIGSLEGMLVDVVSDLTGKMGGETKGAVGDLVGHAKRAAASMRPSIESALEAAAREPGKMAGEAAAASGDAARGAVGGLFSAASGLLDAAAEIVSGEKKPGETKDHEAKNDGAKNDEKPGG